MSSRKLRILPLGGLGEIGMNCLVVEWGEDMILIDCGVQFPDASYAGVDILTPDFNYVRRKIKNLRGIVVTHGHDDHIGGIPFLLKDKDIDVYCTPFPEGLLRQKLTEYEDCKEIRYHRIEPRKKFSVGPFKFDPIPVAHSIIEALGFAMETPVGTIVHTGDFKHDPKELVDGKPISFEPFAEWGKKGVLCLLSDSTNAERMGHTISELDISSSFERLLGEQSGRILIALFASNIKRIEKILRIAHAQGKKVALAGRSMHSYTKLAFDQDSLGIPPETLILLEDVENHPDDKVIVLLTGSQAEPQSALVRIAQCNHKEFQIKNGDSVILSSRFIPGNERNITQMINHLYRQGAEVLYESFHQVHVSGHGFQDELLMMLEAVRPKCFVPVHGEYRHLAKHAKLARKAGVAAENVKIIEDGQLLELGKESIEVCERLELEKGVVVEGVYMAGGHELFSQRAALAKTGIVFLALIRKGKSKKLLTEPILGTHALLYKRDIDPEETLTEAVQTAKKVFKEFSQEPDLSEHVRLEMRRFFRKRVSHKPVVIPLILEA